MIKVDIDKLQNESKQNFLFQWQKFTFEPQNENDTVMNIHEYYTFRITRDADLALEEDEADD